MVATASTGVAKAKFDIDTEDTITLTCQWQNLEDGSLATGARQLRCATSLLATLLYVRSLLAPALLLLDSCSAAFGSLLAATSRPRHLSRRLVLAVAAYAWLSTAC